MKYFCTMLTAALILAASSVNAAEKEYRLFILSGQSNMHGLNPNTSFTPAVEAEFGKDNVIVVKDAKGAQPIREWYKKWKPAKGDEPAATGVLYDRLMIKVNAAIKDKKIKSVTFVWMQGERDASEQHGEVYKESLKGLITQLSEDMERKDITFVIGRLSDCRNNNEHWMMLRKAQVEVAEADPKGDWVETDDLNSEKNKIHYTRDGFKTLGERFAKKAIALLKKL